MAESASICLFAGREEKIQLEKNKTEYSIEMQHVCNFVQTHVFIETLRGRHVKVMSETDITVFTGISLYFTPGYFRAMKICTYKT